MIRSYRPRGGRVLAFLWILFHLCIVPEARRYDKCITIDGRQGVCVLKRYCREANHHALLHCDGDAENHCCPLPTTHSSAQPLSIPVRPEQTKPDLVEKDKQHPRVPETDDRSNKTPPPDHRRPPTRPSRDPPRKPPIGDEKDVLERYSPTPIHPIDDPLVYTSDRHKGDVGQPRPPTRPNNSKRRDQPSRHSNVDRTYPTNHEPGAPKKPEPPRRQNPAKPTTYDSSKGAITFPASAPSPKVPPCGVKPYELFIAGGEKSGEHEWPWMTAIFRRHSDSRPKIFQCGGSLINTKYVLSAAHCFVHNYVILPASSFVVRVGSHFLSSGEEYPVSNLVLHHNHSGSDFFNDIALVRLASEVYVTDKVAPICLPDPGMIYDDLVGRKATVAGWGDTAFRTGHTRILQHVTVPIVSGEECFAAYSRVKGAAFLARGSDHVICAGLREGGKDACLGDSGGPLMLKMPDDRWVIVGIVSLGYKCAEPGYPGVYTRVTHYISWINNNMKKH